MPDEILYLSVRSFLTCSFGKEPIDIVWRGEVKTFRQSLNRWSQLATAQGITLAWGLTLDRSLASHNTPGCSTKLVPKPSQEKRQALTVYRTLTDILSILIWECSLWPGKTILLATVQKGFSLRLQIKVKEVTYTVPQTSRSIFLFPLKVCINVKMMFVSKKLHTYEVIQTFVQTLVLQNLCQQSHWVESRNGKSDLKLLTWPSARKKIKHSMYYSIILWNTSWKQFRCKVTRWICEISHLKSPQSRITTDQLHSCQ